MDPELERKRKELERRLASHRRKFPVVIAVIVAAMLLIVVIAFQFTGDSRNVALLAGVVLTGLLLFALPRWFPGLACPACEQECFDDFGAYCPECGTHGLSIVDKHYKAECRNCKRALGFSGKVGGARTRRFQIRFCTNCGLSFGQRPL